MFSLFFAVGFSLESYRPALEAVEITVTESADGVETVVSGPFIEPGSTITPEVVAAFLAQESDQ